MTKSYFPAILFLTGALVVSCTNGSRSKKAENASSTDSLFLKVGSIVRLDKRMDQIIAPDELPEIIAKGFSWTEGPLWLPDQNILLFSDIPSNSIFQWSEKDGMKLYLKPSGYTDTIKRGGETGSNGLLIDKNGMLILCQHGDRRIARMDSPIAKPEPKFVSIADRWNGKRFNSPNDAVFNSKGDLYFTDPAYGMEHGYDDSRRETNFTGVYKCTSDGNVILLTDKLANPNGIGLSPDETKLYIANSGKGDKAFWMEYEFNKDGTLSEGKMFHNTSEKQEGEMGSPDGLKVRNDGIIFATGPGGVWVFSLDGVHLGTIRTGEATSNCALDEKGKYLYITADKYIMRIKFK